MTAASTTRQNSKENNTNRVGSRVLIGSTMGGSRPERACCVGSVSVHAMEPWSHEACIFPVIPGVTFSGPSPPANTVFGSEIRLWRTMGRR